MTGITARVQSLAYGLVLRGRLNFATMIQCAIPDLGGTS